MFNHRNVVNMFIVYELETWPKSLNTDFTLPYCFLGAVCLTENVDPDKY